MAEVAIRLQATCKVSSLEAAVRLDEESGGTGCYGGLPIEVIGRGLYKDLKPSTVAPTLASPPSSMHPPALAALLANVPGMGALPSLPSNPPPPAVVKQAPLARPDAGGRAPEVARPAAQAGQSRPAVANPSTANVDARANAIVSASVRNTKDGEEEAKTTSTVTTTRLSTTFASRAADPSPVVTTGDTARRGSTSNLPPPSASPKSSTTAVRVTISEPKPIGKHTTITTVGGVPASSSNDMAFYGDDRRPRADASRRFSAPTGPAGHVVSQESCPPPKPIPKGTLQREGKGGLGRRHGETASLGAMRDAGPKPLRSSGVRSLDEKDVADFLEADSAPPRQPLARTAVVTPLHRPDGPPASRTGTGQTAAAVVPAARPTRPLFHECAFKEHYDAAKAPQFPHQLLDAVHSLIFGYAAHRGIDETKAEAFFRELQDTAFTHVKELLSDIESAAGRIWTSPKRMEDREFCFILNDVIRQDLDKLMPCAATISRAINLLLVNVRLTGGVCGVVYRGGGLPDEHRGFYVPSRTYRVPMFLATSVDRNTSVQQFCRRAGLQQRLPPVLWVVHLDQQVGCMHVNHIKRSECEGEEEYLFSPYSVFTVQEVTWKEKPTWQDPHVVHLLAAADNRLAPETLPLAPWA
eukprot:GGOE01036932.1.p1 GENE.GGOE01036932.1~~GGOE01036932.1.p1  ORF type:complete len:650 (+),score=124.20 GGOE01036932.1:36-1952(+)